MKILLIIPKYNLTTKPSYEYAFPLGLAYVSAAMKKAGYDVDCINLNHLEGKSEDLIKNALDKEKYDIVCTGHMGIGYAIVEKISMITRKHDSKPIIILGGALMTSEPELMFNSLKPDFAVLGEGDITIVELLRCIEKKTNPEKVDGICFEKDGKTVFTKSRELVKDLDSLPFPDLEGFEFKKYLDNQSNVSNYMAQDYPRFYLILCSRGCPNQCTFCYHSVGFKYRLRSLESIFNEIENAIKTYNINSLSILDDLFSLDKKRLFEFCRRIKELSKKNNFKIKWDCQLTVKDAEETLLRTLKDAGCNVVSFGFESYSPLVLKSMRNPITPEQIDNAVKLSFKVGIGLQGSYIFGDVAETRQTAHKTLEYWKNNCKGQIKIGFIQPYPGSEIFNHFVRKCIIKNKLDFIKNHIAHTNWINMTDNMADEVILDLKKEMLKARREHYPYIIPLKIKKATNNRYEIMVKCPFCNEKIDYKNCPVENKFHFNIWTACRKCNMRFCVVSKLYKFGMDNYNALDFIRRNYLLIRDQFLKKKM